MIKACIFDLDGVIVDTAKYHYQAWRRIAYQLGFEFTEEQNEDLKGISRRASLEKLLVLGEKELNDREKDKYCLTKNTWYLELIQNIDHSEMLPGVSEFISHVKGQGLKVALGSASKNARRILERIGITDQFDTIVDGTDIVNSKPDPEVFLKAAELMGVIPGQTIVIEDSEKGLEAARKGGFYSIGIGSGNLSDYCDILMENLDGARLTPIIESLTHNGFARDPGLIKNSN